MMEIPILVALAGIATAIGFGQKSWLVGLAVFFGVPLALFAFFVGWEALYLEWTLARARRMLGDPAKRLDAVQRLEANGFQLKEAKWIAGRAARTLRAALGDPDPHLRAAAARALARLEQHADEAVPVLVEALRDEAHVDETYRALQCFGPRAAPAVPALVERLADRRSSLWWRVVSTLQTIGPAARPAVPALIASLDGISADEANWPLYALGAIGDPAALPALRLLAASGKDERVQEHARDAIRRIEATAARAS